MLMIGWKRTKPSYEEFYITDVPMDTVSEFGHGYTFPALFRVGDAASGACGVLNIVLGLNNVPRNSCFGYRCKPPHRA